MKVLFIYPDVGTLIPADYQHGLGVLMAVLKKAGHEAGLIYAHDELERGDLIGKVRAFDPGLVAFTSVSSQFQRAARYAEWIKDSERVPTVIGGVHATLSPEEVMARPGFDMLCRGEGEEALLELADGLEAGHDVSGLANLWVKRGGDVVRNKVRPLIRDLDELPFPDRGPFDFERILEGKDGACSMLMGRGCPYDCAYCANEGLRALYKGGGQYVRTRSVDSVLEEMRSLLERYDVKKWEFNDDVFTLKKNWMMEFLDRYPREFSLPFDVNVRVETADRASLFALKKAGCEQIRVGVESGSDRVRAEIMGRRMPRESIISVFRNAEEAGLKTWSFNMVGLPGETEEDAMQTVRLNDELGPDQMQVSVFNPYPGTRLYDLCLERGVISDDSRDGYFLPESALKLPEFHPDAIKRVHAELIRTRDKWHTKKKLLALLGGKPPFLDLVDALEDARIQTPEPIFVGEDFFWIGRDARRTLRIHPPSRALFKLRLPAAPQFRFSLAMHPQVLDRPGGDGVVFTVRVGRFVRTMKKVFEKTIDPKRREEDRGWLDQSIDLDAWAKRKVYLEISTRTADPDSPDHNTVGLGYPIIVERD